MSDLIRREDAIEMLCKNAQGYTVSKFLTSSECYVAKAVATDCAVEVKNLPAVDALPVRHGRWIPMELHRSLGVFVGVGCSQCEYEKIGSGYNYCPNCGAKMDGGETDENAGRD